MPLTHFHPSVQRWFREHVGEPSEPQRLGWPAIRAAGHTLIAAPTGSGKTLAAFLWAIDALLREPGPLPDETHILYISPLKALGNDVQKNLQLPLAQLREIDATLPELRVVVRSGDTPMHERTAMGRRPPHILVTTPESLYILLTSDSGRAMLRTVRTVIIDEIHAILGDKRGAHLALSLERLEALTTAQGASPPQRIGLSATQKPLSAVGQFLAGQGRECTLIDAGMLRALDLDVEIPSSPLEAVCSHETWEEIYTRMGELIQAHRTTLIFVNTRKLAERIAGHLTRLLGAEAVTCHHGSLARARRLDAEQRLKAGTLRALVATASLELGIDIGDVDLVIQCGATRSIAALLQRVGRSGHGIGRVPKGRLFPLTRDELVEAAALVSAIRAGELDRTPQPRQPLDILAQQIVAACVPETWDEPTLYATFTHAWPYRELTRGEFDDVVALHTVGRAALLHRDGVQGRLRATRRARIVAITSGGAIPDSADYRVLAQPDETYVGTVNEDFAVESNKGDIFQLGNTSWRIVKLEPGIIRVADAQGQPASVPFWLGEAPARTAELSGAVSAMREAAAAQAPDKLAAQIPINPVSMVPIHEYMLDGQRALGAIPTRERVILERFFDETGGMQLILHAPFGNAINRAWGLALRKRFCRRFGFELQAAANEDAILLSLGPQHSFPLEEVFGYLRSATARTVLVQALLDAPMFETRWRWNSSRALLVPRFAHGRRLPAPLARMRSQDLLAAAFPDVLACGENLPPGDLNVPMEHPLVRQTVEDCLHEAMDVDGFLDVLRGIESGAIETLAVDTPAPSPFALGILNANLYSFLDDAPLEERRTQAVIRRRALDNRTADTLGALDPAAVARVREEAWPQPRDAEEVHEALLWMGYVTDAEAVAWGEWLAELAAAGRVQHAAGRWLASEATRDAKAQLRGRLEALGPIFALPEEEPLLLALEADGHVMRTRLEGRDAWCDRRLLARIQRYTLDTLRREIEPVTAAQFLHYLACWQHVDPAYQLDGPGGVATILDQLAGFEAPVVAWEKSILPARVRDYRPEMLDHLTLAGEFAWGRLWGAGNAAVRSAPLCFVRRADLDHWLALAEPVQPGEFGAHARRIWQALEQRGAMFHADLMRTVHLLPEPFESGLGELIGRGALSCDSFGGLRLLLRPAHRRRAPFMLPGRWSPFRPAAPEMGNGTSSSFIVPSSSLNENSSLIPHHSSLPKTVTRNPQPVTRDPDPEFIARQLLKRYGVVFKRMLTRERIGTPWRDLIRVYRHMELTGEARGGRFVGGFSGEQYALPQAVELLRKLRREGRSGAANAAVTISPADPLNLQGILTPDERIPATTHSSIALSI